MDGLAAVAEALGIAFRPGVGNAASAYVGRADAMTELEQLFWLVAVSAASVIAVLVWTAVCWRACASIAACTRGSPARA